MRLLFYGYDFITNLMTFYSTPDGSAFTEVSGLKTDGRWYGTDGVDSDDLATVGQSVLTDTTSPVDAGLIWVGTQAEYDAIPSPAATTLHFISDAPNPFVVTNDVWTASRTASDLNTDFPDAGEGFMVIAEAITGGAEIYTKTATTGN